MVFCGGPAPKSCGPTRDVNANAGRFTKPRPDWASHETPNRHKTSAFTFVDDKSRGNGNLLKIAWVPGELMASSCGVGTKKSFGPLLRTRMPSVEAKKNSLPLRTGPPAVPPNWWRLNTGRGKSCVLLSNVF